MGLRVSEANRVGTTRKSTPLLTELESRVIRSGSEEHLPSHEALACALECMAIAEIVSGLSELLERGCSPRN